MAKYRSRDSGRIGAIIRRTHAFNMFAGRWAKPDTGIRYCVDTRTDGAPSLGVRQQKGEDRAQ